MIEDGQWGRDLAPQLIQDVFDLPRHNEGSVYREMCPTCIFLLTRYKFHRQPYVLSITPFLRWGVCFLIPFQALRSDVKDKVNTV